VGDKLLLFLLLFVVIIYMQGIYSYISDTHHVSRVYLAAAVCSYNVWYKQFYFLH